MPTALVPPTTKYRLSRRSIRMVVNQLGSMTLRRQQYSEQDEEDSEKVQSKEVAHEVNTTEKWMSKAVNRVLISTTIMAIIAAFITGFCCYIFIQLPPPIYSTHVLEELLRVRSDIIHENGFSLPIGPRVFVPLPLVNFFMYVYIGYFVYIIQYPKGRRGWIRVRYCLCAFGQIYLTFCVGVYIANHFKVDRLLDDFHKHDQKGLKTNYYRPRSPPVAVPLHFLKHAQEYYGCCGFKSKYDWKKVYPQKFKDTWPLTCCDVSGAVACYEPVKIYVTYEKREDPPGRDMKNHTAKRLYQGTCHPWERNVTLVVLSLVTILTFMFDVLGLINVILIARVTYLVNNTNFELMTPERYPDYF